MLVDWHKDPDVKQFWDGRAFTRQEMETRLRRPLVDAYIIEAAGEPVGYLQAWFGETADMGGLDMFLIPSARGGHSDLTPHEPSRPSCRERRTHARDG